MGCGGTCGTQLRTALLPFPNVSPRFNPIIRIQMSTGATKLSYIQGDNKAPKSAGPFLSRDALTSRPPLHTKTMSDSSSEYSSGSEADPHESLRTPSKTTSRSSTGHSDRHRHPPTRIKSLKEHTSSHKSQRDSSRDTNVHNRSTPEAVSAKINFPPRDAGIVGTAISPSGTMPSKQHIDVVVHAAPTSQARPPSPSGIPDTPDQTHHRSSPTVIPPSFSRNHADRSTDHSVPPLHGDIRLVTAPVAPQTVIMPPAIPFYPAPPSPYLYYQPGVHSTAGPLPPPPRAIFNIDTKTPPPPRPPRLHSPPPSNRPRGDMEAVRQALQLPPSVAAALAAKSLKQSAAAKEDTPKSTSTTPASSIDVRKQDTPLSTPPSQIHASPSIHRREGASTSVSATVSDTAVAISASTLSPSENTPPNGSRTSIGIAPEGGKDPGSAESPSIMVIEPPPRLDSLPVGPDHEHEDNWVNISRELSPSPDSRTSAEFAMPDNTRSQVSPDREENNTPSPPPKSFRNSLTTNLKRFSSLPRTPSSSTKSIYHPPSESPHPSLGSPSSPYHPTFERLPHQRIISQSPPAMYCHEVYSAKTALERCAIYASKINELYMYDCGLGNWVIEAQFRGLNSGSNRPASIQSNQAFMPQPRQTSRSSMMSEATFPRRPDASTATDLSYKSSRDNMQPTAPPPLPYPSLAQSQRSYPSRSPSTASGTPPSSVRSLAPAINVVKAGGFFSSLGRKTSVSKRDKAGPTSPTFLTSPPTRLLTKNPPVNHAPRQVNPSASPSVPGGPRAPPNRVARSQSIMTTSSPYSSSSPTFERNDTLTRRPSLFNMSLEPVMDIQPDPEFVRQVDKLADLLPQADRDVLAGYLRRSGQDILAIGQYLEDEKNGTIRY